LAADWVAGALAGARPGLLEVAHAAVDLRRAMPERAARAMKDVRAVQHPRGVELLDDLERAAVEWQHLRALRLHLRRAPGELLGGWGPVRPGRAAHLSLALAGLVAELEERPQARRQGVVDRHERRGADVLAQGAILREQQVLEVEHQGVKPHLPKRVGAAQERKPSVDRRIGHGMPRLLP